MQYRDLDKSECKVRTQCENALCLHTHEAEILHKVNYNVLILCTLYLFYVLVLS